MNAVVVYESHWGNGAAVARAVAAGIGPETLALSTGEASGLTLEHFDLIVAGAPLLCFRLPNEKTLELVRSRGKAPAPPDVSQPLLRSWLAGLVAGSGRSAAYETAFRRSPGSATGTILDELERLGYRRLVEGERFFLAGTYGPLREGELERACEWGARLARAMAIGRYLSDSAESRASAA